MSSRRFVTLLSGLALGACSKSDAPAPTRTAAESVGIVQRELAIPTAPAPPLAPVQAPLDAAMSSGCLPSAAGTAAPPGSGSSMVRLLGTPPARLPTSPLSPAGESPHLFQLGAVAFFLDHDELALTVDQRSTLSAVRDRAVLDYATQQRQIDQGEQDLWSLTAADQPYASAVEAKLTMIARHSVQQRLNYIRAVGEALAEISPSQRQQLLGGAPGATGVGAAPMAAGAGSSGPPAAVSAGSASTTMPGMPGASGPPAGGMGDM